MIKQLSNNEQKKQVSWKYGNSEIIKNYKYRAYVAAPVRGDFVVMVDHNDFDNPHNAVIYNSDGSFRKRVENPYIDQGTICFDNVYLSGEELILTSVCPRVFYSCKLDANGDISNTNETR